MIIAPAGPMNKPVDRDDIKRSRERLEALGLHVRVGEDLFRREGFLAGPDEVRVAELNAALRDPNVRAVFPGRGGYGITRILDRIDYDAIQRDPKIILGFSDITALHLAVNQRTGLITFHSPNAVWGLGNEKGMPATAERFFWRAILADKYGDELGYRLGLFRKHATRSTDEPAVDDDCPVTPATMVGGQARGRLTGGNLSLVAALMGTPHEIETNGKILFLEDIGEAPYRVDRMLSTLRLAGKFDQLAGVVLGQFTRRGEEVAEDGETTIEEVLVDYFHELGVPVIKDFPVGHVECNLTLPIGALCELDADTQSIRLLENPVRLNQ